MRTPDEAYAFLTVLKQRMQYAGVSTCDMEKGRARIPMLLNTEARPGDIHKYSSTAVERIRIEPGTEKPIRIEIEMSESVGFFQVEEVLFPKLNMSAAKRYIELYAGITGAEQKRYL